MIQILTSSKRGLDQFSYTVHDALKYTEMLKRNLRMEMGRNTIQIAQMFSKHMS